LPRGVHARTQQDLLFTSVFKDTQIQLIMSRKPSTSYLETYFEVVAEMERRSDSLYSQVDGMGAKWELAETIADEFEKEHVDTYWDNHPSGWLETLESFLDDRLKEFPINKTRDEYENT